MKIYRSEGYGSNILVIDAKTKNPITGALVIIPEPDMESIELAEFLGDDDLVDSLRDRIALIRGEELADLP